MSKKKSGEQYLDRFGENQNYAKGQFYPYYRPNIGVFFFCDKSLKFSRKKQEQNYSLFFGVVATMAATFAKKSFFEEITSSEKVRVKIFEQKTSEHAIKLA